LRINLAVAGAVGSNTAAAQQQAAGGDGPVQFLGGAALLGRGERAPLAPQLASQLALVLTGLVFSG
jgi:hypothetical protein